MKKFTLGLLFAFSGIAAAFQFGLIQEAPRAHAFYIATSEYPLLPQRPLPALSRRPLVDGPKRFVDAVKGDDQADGSEKTPWKTLVHSLRRLKAGDTLYLRGGVYYEHVVLTQSGTAEAPITICS